MHFWHSRVLERNGARLYTVVSSFSFSVDLRRIREGPNIVEDTRTCQPSAVSVSEAGVRGRHFSRGERGGERDSEGLLLLGLLFSGERRVQCVLRGAVKILARSKRL